MMTAEQKIFTGCYSSFDICTVTECQLLLCLYC